MKDDRGYWEKLLAEHLDNIDTGTRTASRLKDVSPCSEYTRYTVEGIFKDPHSDLSVILDMRSLGFLFANSGLKRPKWSEALGYGMAMVGDETRIHVHKNGKFIIRRAMDREDAERNYRKIASILWPALFSTRTDLFNWASLRRRYLGDDEKDPIEDEMVIWPEAGIDPQDTIEEIMGSIDQIERSFGEEIRSSLMKKKVSDEGSVLEIRDQLLEIKMKNSQLLALSLSKEDITLNDQKARLTFHLWKDIGLGHLEKILDLTMNKEIDIDTLAKVMTMIKDSDAIRIEDMMDEVKAGYQTHIAGIYLLLC